MIDDLMIHPVTVIYQDLSGSTEDGTPTYGTSTRWTGYGWMKTPREHYPRAQQGQAEAVKRIELRTQIFLPVDAEFSADDQFIVTVAGVTSTWDCRGGTPVETPFVGLHHFEVSLVQMGNP